MITGNVGGTMEKSFICRIGSMVPHAVPFSLVLPLTCLPPWAIDLGQDGDIYGATTPVVHTLKCLLGISAEASIELFVPGLLIT